MEIKRLHRPSEILRELSCIQNDIDKMNCYVYLDAHIFTAVLENYEILDFNFLYRSTPFSILLAPPLKSSAYKERSTRLTKSGSISLYLYGCMRNVAASIKGEL